MSKLLTADVQGGSWGWIVVLSSFFMYLLSEGITASISILYIPILKELGSNRGTTALIPAALICATYIFGPVISGLILKTGYRKAALAGSVVSSLGLVICSISTNITQMFFAVFLLLGLGFSATMLTSVLCVTSYFQKYRSIAIGLSYTGYSVGIFVIPAFSEWLLHLYGWRGATLIQAGIALNGAICATLFRPITADSNDQTSERIESYDVNYQVQKDSHNSLEQGGKSIFFVQCSLPSAEFRESINTESCCKSSNKIQRNRDPSFQNSLSHLPNTSSNERYQDHNRLNQRKISTNPVTDCPRHSKTIPYLSYSDPLIYGTFQTQHCDSTLPEDKCLSNNPEVIQNHRTEKESVLSVRKSDPHDDPIKEKQNMNVESTSRTVSHVFKDMFDFSLLIKHSTFAIFCISKMTATLGYYTSIIFTPDRAIEIGIVTEYDLGILVPIIGIGGIIGRVLSSYVAELGIIRSLWLYGIFTASCGGSVLISILINDYYTMLLCNFALGFFSGGHMVLTPISVVEIIGTENMRKAHGIVMLSMGFGAFVATPIAGGLHDVTESHVLGFLFAGIMLILSGLMAFLGPCIQKWR